MDINSLPQNRTRISEVSFPRFHVLSERLTRSHGNSDNRILHESHLGPHELQIDVLPLDRSGAIYTHIALQLSQKQSPSQHSNQYTYLSIYGI